MLRIPVLLAKSETLLNFEENDSIMSICPLLEDQIADSDYSLSGFSGCNTQNIETPNKHAVHGKLFLKNLRASHVNNIITV